MMMNFTTGTMSQLFSAQIHSAKLTSNLNADMISNPDDLLSHPDELFQFAQIIDKIKLSPDVLGELFKIAPDLWRLLVEKAKAIPGLLAVAQEFFNGGDILGSLEAKVMARAVRATSPATVGSIPGLGWLTGLPPGISLGVLTQQVPQGETSGGAPEPAEDPMMAFYEQAGVVLAGIGFGVGAYALWVAIGGVVLAILGVILAVPTGGASLLFSLVCLLVACFAAVVGALALGVGIAALIVAVLPAAYRKRKVLGTGAVSIQAPNGQYISAQNGGGGQLYANRNAVLAWESFRVVDHGSGKISLQAANRQLISAAGVTTYRATLGDNGGTFETGSGGGGIVTVDRDAIDSWEIFILEPKGTGKYAFRTLGGYYIRTDDGGGLGVTAYDNYCNPATSIFTVTLLSGLPPDGMVLNTLPMGGKLTSGQFIQSVNGRYKLVYQTDGNLVLLGPENTVLWNAGTYDTKAGQFVMQSDGNIVVYDGNGKAAWASSEHGGSFGPGPEFKNSQLVMGEDGNLVVLAANNAVLWQSHTSQTGQVEGESHQPSVPAGPAIVGIGMDNQLYGRATLSSPWEGMGTGGKFKAVTLVRGGSFVGVGTDNQLYRRAALSSTWELVPGSGDVKGVTSQSDGSFVGVGMDNQLYRRATLSSAWANIPNSGDVMAITALPDGSIVGVGMDNQLYRRATLSSAWENVPSSYGVMAITALPDGSIVGVGLDNQLYRRATLSSAWENVPSSYGVMAIASLNS